MTWTLTGAGQTYTSSTQPIYDAAFRLWRCTDAIGAAFNVTDFIGETFVVSGTPAQTQFTPPEFQADLFLATELIAIRASADPVVKAWLALLDDPRLVEVDLSKPSTRAAIDYLASISLLTAERAAAIKAGTSPY